MADDSQVNQIIEKFIKAHPSGDLILDGFPRHLAQVEWLKVILEEQDLTGVTQLIELSARSEVVTERAQKRHRADDATERFAHRLDIFNSEIRPAIERLKQLFPYHVVDGAGTIESVHQRVTQALGLSRS